MAAVETLSAYACSLAGAELQDKLTPADLAWALEIPAVSSLLTWLADVVHADERAGGTTALNKEEREIWDRAQTLKVVKDIPTQEADGVPSSTPASYRTPTELAEMASMNQSIAALKERRVRQLELNIDRLRTRLDAQAIGNDARLQAEDALAREISTLESDLTSFGLLISSTLIPTLLDSLHTSLSPHLHPPSSSPAHLTQSAGPLHAVASASTSLSSRVSALPDARPLIAQSNGMSELDVEAQRLEGVFQDLREDAWEKEMASFLQGDDDSSGTCVDGDHTTFVSELLTAGRERDRLEQAEREVVSLKIAKTHLSDTLLPTALVLQVALSNDVNMLRELEALGLALADEIDRLGTGEFRSAPMQDTDQQPSNQDAQTKNQEALRLLLSSSGAQTEPILDHADFSAALSNLNSTNSSTKTLLADRILSLARHSSGDHAAKSVDPLLNLLTTNSPTPLHPLLARSKEVRRAEVEFDRVREETGKLGWEYRPLDAPAEKAEIKGAERIVRENSA